MNRTSAVVEFKLVARFEKLRKQLLDESYSDRLDKPLAFWVLPNDRRLPLAFMGWTIRDLLSTPFEELLGTAGVGQKKIISLVALLARVATELPSDDMSDGEFATSELSSDGVNGDDVFEPATVSEALWTKWQTAIRSHGLGSLPLGRFTPSLQHLPRVLWNTPLDTYTGLKLDEIRGLKTHGEKRVTAVLEVFCHLYQIVGNFAPQKALSVVIQPAFVVPLEEWVLKALDQKGTPTTRDIQRRFVRPLLYQTEVDAGDHIARLAENRLGLGSGESSVRKAARKLGLTRARVYQLLQEIGSIFTVRWPKGQPLVAQLSERIESESTRQEQLDLFLGATDLFFPGTSPVSADRSDVRLPVGESRRAG